MQKKIKLVISDLHIGKGRILEGGTLNSFEEFYYDDKFIEFLHFYCTGNYQDVAVELIINGDFFNFLQVDYRGHFLTVVTELVALEKTKKIISGHSEVFESLRFFASQPNKEITYIVGNHDQEMLWPANRAYLNEVVGTSIRYKNLVYYFDGIHIEHGHMHEAANRFDPKKFFLKQDLPEPILNLPFGSHFFIGFVLKVKKQYPHLDKVRPFRRMLRWSIFNETLFSIKTICSLFFYLLKSASIKDPRRHWTLRRILQIIWDCAIFPDLGEAARRILQDERINTVIFGHSHVYQYRQWSDGKEYFNTGTWTELTSLDIHSLGKITKLTYVLIEYPTVEGGRPQGNLKEWRGHYKIESNVVVS